MSSTSARGPEPFSTNARTATENARRNSERNTDARDGRAGTGDSREYTPWLRRLLRHGTLRRLLSWMQRNSGELEGRGAYGILNPVNCLCAQVKQRFEVHLRIHRNNVRLWLDEKAFQRERMGSVGFDGYLSFLYRRIFLSGKTLRRRGVFAL